MQDCSSMEGRGRGLNTAIKAVKLVSSLLFINFSMKVSLIGQKEVTVPEPLVHFSWPQ